jgi:hypothetical protein
MSIVPLPRTTAARFGAAAELFSFLWANKKWWLAPMVGGIFILGALILLANSSAIAPWVFSLF